MKNSLACLIILGLLFVCNNSLMAAEKNKTTPSLSWEELANCKLPNAVTILPGQGTYLASKGGGTVFSFSQQKFSPEPDLDEKDFTVKKFIALLKGDIYYATPENSCFVVTSGRIVDLGKHFLYEFDGKEFPRPKVKITKQDGQDVPGLMTGIKELTGHCFLLETKDQKYVLLRIVSQDRIRKQQARVQWVYQPNGTRIFDIPKGKIHTESISSKNKEAIITPPSLARVNILEFIKAIDNHKENRKKIVQHCIKVFSKDNSSVYRTFSRATACDTLGEMRASEASSILAANIDDHHPLPPVTTVTEMSLDDCRAVYALIKIGIPGASAAIHQIELDTKKKPKKERENIWSHDIEIRRKLLATVVLRVYGDKLTKIVFEDRISQTDDPKVKAAFQQLTDGFTKLKTWFPEEKKDSTETKSSKNVKEK